MGHKSVTNDPGIDEMSKHREICPTNFTRPKKYGTKIGESRQIEEGLTRFEAQTFFQQCS